MATIYSIAGVTLTEGVQDCAIKLAKNIARDRRERVIVEDGATNWLVGPRGGVKKMTDRIKRKLGFNA